MTFCLRASTRFSRNTAKGRLLRRKVEAVSETPLEKYTGSILGDIASIFGVPTGTASQLFRDFINRRGEKARDILLEELSAGDIDEFHAASDDEAISIIYRYALAVRDGAANRNLRLLAQSMVGLAQRDRLFSDEFNKYAEVLSRLSRDQIFVLARYYGIYQTERNGRSDGQLVITNSWTTLKKAMVPTEFETEQHIEVILAQCAAFGLMLPNLAIGGPSYLFSPLMNEIMELAKFQDALREED